MPAQDDTKPIYERLQDEPAKWFAKFLLYRNMKAIERSYIGAYTIYLSESQKGLKRLPKALPPAWRDAIEKYDWKFRAEQYDAVLQAEQEERQRILREVEAAEIEAIMTTGYAAKHERIKALSAMADLIKTSFLDEENKKINFAWVTPDKIREFRGCMDDIAKELGDRVVKKELTGKDGGPVIFTTEWGGGALAFDEEVDEG